MIEEEVLVLEETVKLSQNVYKIIDLNSNPIILKNLKETLSKFEYLSQLQTVWIDFQALTKEDAMIIQDYFLIHPLTIEDILINDSGEKFDTFSDYNHISMQIQLERSLDEVEYIHIIQKQNFILTFHQTSIDFSQIIKILYNTQNALNLNIDDEKEDKGIYFSDEKIEIIEKSLDNPQTDVILFSILYWILDSLIPEADAIVNEVHFCDEIISSIEGDKDASDLISRIKAVRKSMASCHGSLSSKLEVIKIVREKAPFITLDIEEYLKDLKDRVKKSINMIEFARDNLSSSHSNYIQKIDLHRRNKRKGTDRMLNGFGFFAIIFIPFSTITGLFGMNCPVPYQDSNSLVPFFVITGSCILLSLILLVISIYYKRSSRKKKFKMKLIESGIDSNALLEEDLTERVIQIISVQESPIIIQDISEFQDKSEEMMKKSSIWLDLQNPTQDDLDYLVKTFEIAKEMMDDYNQNVFTEKCEFYQKYNHFILRYDINELNFERGKMIHLFHFPNLIISLHKGQIEYFDLILNKVKNYFEFQKVKEEFDYNFEEYEVIEEVKEIISIPSEWILFKLLDGIIDYFVIISERLSDEAENCDELILSLNISEHADLFMRINQTKKMITIAHLSTVPKLRIIQNLLRSKGFENLQDHFKTMHFNVQKAIQRIDHSRENLNSSQRNYTTRLKLKGAESLEKQRNYLNLISSITFLVAPSASFGELFRMNVMIPFQEVLNLGPFFGIVIFIALMTILLYLISFIYFWYQRKKLK